jgi:aminoglycoside 6'-N-acetyltransferase
MSTLRADPLPRLSGRVTLRRLCAGDLAAFQEYRHDAELGRYQGWSPMTDAEARAFLTEMSDAPLFAPGAWSQLGISESTEPRLIGDIGLFLAADSRHVEIGFTLSRRYQGQGLATAAVRLLERVGLRRAETKATVFRGEPCVEHVYQLSRGDG